MTGSSRFEPNLTGRRRRRRAPTILQMEATECGAACLGMILAHYGKWVPLEELRIRCGVSRDGSKAVSMLRAAREYGLEAQGFRREHAERLFDLPFPMILYWRFSHFVVLEGMEKGQYCIVDPAHGPRKIAPQEFDEAFTGVCLAFAPGPRFERSGSPPRVLRDLAARIGQARVPLAFVGLATLALVAPGLAIPALQKVFVDDVLVPRSEHLVPPLLIGLGLAAVMQGALVWLQQTVLMRMEIKLALVQTSRFFWHVVTLPMTFFGQRFAGDIADRVASNDKVARIISGQLATNAVNVFTMLIYGAVMFTYDAVLTLIAIGMAALNVGALLLVSRAREDGNRRLVKERGKVAGTSVNGIFTIETIKANGTENEFFSRWAGVHANSLSAQQELGALTNLLNAVPPLLASLSTVAILGIGGLRILDGALTIGGLVAFQTLARTFAGPIEGLVQFGASLQTVKGDIARLDDVLRHEPDRRAVAAVFDRAEEAPEALRGFVELDEVTFGYNAKEPPLIDGFSLRVAPGQRVALVGGSGSGKSTVGRLVCGLLQPWSGEVRVDDREVGKLPPGHFTDAVAYVDQESLLFEASVRENVTLWNSAIGEHDVSSALRDAAILGEVMERPEKYETPVGENGRNFSGGQRQRLEIARALASNPSVLVLDEATAALDPSTELEIDDRLRERGCSCLIVAHRLSTIRDADEIVVLERGRVVQRGTHDDLVAVEGAYRNLIASG